jgi:hypothetical protein
VAQNESVSELCMLGEDYEAPSNCVLGAVKSLSQESSQENGSPKDLEEDEF